MEQLNLFSIPVFRFKFTNHVGLKNSIMDTLINPEIYQENTGPTNSLHLTNPNLHRQENLKPFVDFAHDCLRATMMQLGFEPLIQLTGLWATQHSTGEYHHRHSHSNSFLAGVYYLNGMPNSAGTRFFNTHRNHRQIIPARLPNQEMLISNTHTVPFIEGTLLVFPSWLEHNTEPNQSVSARHILSFNAMPVGPTNQDQFDRYNYQDISQATMISSRNERIGK